MLLYYNCIFGQLAIFQIMSYSSKAIVSTLFTTVENESSAEKSVYLCSWGPKRAQNPKAGQVNS